MSASWTDSLMKSNFHPGTFYNLIILWTENYSTLHVDIIFPHDRPDGIIK